MRGLRQNSKPVGLVVPLLIDATGSSHHLKGTVFFRLTSYIFSVVFCASICVFTSSSNKTNVPPGELQGLVTSDVDVDEFSCSSLAPCPLQKKAASGHLCAQRSPKKPKSRSRSRSRKKRLCLLCRCILKLDLGLAKHFDCTVWRQVARLPIGG